MFDLLSRGGLRHGQEEGGCRWDRAEAAGGEGSPVDGQPARAGLG